VYYKAKTENGVRPTRVWCTLEYVIPVWDVLSSTPHPGRTYSTFKFCLEYTLPG